MHYKRMLVAVFLLIAVTASLLSACNSKPAKLSDMGDEELLQYLTDAGVTIPEKVEFETVRRMIVILEDDPDFTDPARSDAKIKLLFDELRVVVTQYDLSK